VVVVLLLTACGAQATQAPQATTAPQPTAGGGSNQDLIATGTQVFDQNCSGCHALTTQRVVGPGLAGLFSVSSLPNGQSFSEANLANWIRTGGRGMPGFPLSDQQMAALVAYLKQATAQ
jgi:cytochrome c